MKQGVDCGVGTERGEERVGLKERREGTLQLGCKINKFIKIFILCLHLRIQFSHSHFRNGMGDDSLQLLEPSIKYTYTQV